MKEVELIILNSKIIRNRSLSGIGSFFILTLLLCCFFSCSSEEEIQGCTDPSASNYNADATIDGTCTFLRDEFIGNYTLQLSNCSRDEDFLMNLGVSISPNIQSTQDVDVAIAGVFSQSLIFKARVAGDNLIFDNSTDDAFVSLVADALVYNNTAYLFPTFELNGTLSKAGTTLSGRLTLAAADADNNDVGIFSVICDFKMDKTN